MPNIVTTCFMTEVVQEKLSHFFLPFLAIFCFTKLPQMATTCFMTEVAKNGNKWLHIIAKNGNKQNDLQLYRELKSLFCHFWQYFASLNCHKRQLLALWQKLPKMATMCCMTKVAQNDNFYWPQSCQKWQSCRSGQKWQFLLTSKLPQMATICLMAKVAKNGNKWLHIIAKNGNKQNDLQLYRELKSLFCHFWQYFAFSSAIILSKNCQKWQ